MDAIVVLMALEAVALLAVRRLLDRGPPALAILASLAAGLFLLLALRAALTGAGWPVMAGALAAALFAHLLDLKLRWPAGTDTPAQRAHSEGGRP